MTISKSSYHNKYFTKKNIFFLFFLFFILVVGCKKAPPAPILSEEHAKLNRSISDSTKQTESESYLKSGDALNSKKLYPQAIEAYEKGLQAYPTALLYYQYGNTLANAKRYEDAIKSYQLAIKLYYEKEHLAYYNIACMNSLLQKKEESLKYLSLAIENGYKNLAHIKRDSDMEWLRQNYPQFNEFLDEELKKKVERDEANSKICTSPAGKGLIDAPGGGQISTYFYGQPNAESGRIEYKAEFGNITTIKTGDWTISGDTISIHYSNESGTRGVGQPTEGIRGPEYSNVENYSKSINENITMSFQHVKDWPMNVDGSCWSK